MMKDFITAYLKTHIELANMMLDEGIISTLSAITETAIDCLNTGGKIVFFGNGGSAADAQHLAAELVGKFKKERKALPAMALNTNISIITSIGNDYSYDKIFSRQVEALVTENDVVIGLSTSGNSDSVIEAMKSAKQKKARTIGLTGRTGGRLKDVVDICLMIPSDDTPLIQEMHITLGHLLCLMIEDKFS